MNNVIPLDLKARLLRLGFNEPDVIACIEALGTQAPIDRAAAWLGVRALEACLRSMGLTRINGNVWEKDLG